MKKDIKGHQSSLLSLLKDASQDKTQALARLLSFVERDLRCTLQFLSKQKVEKHALRLGITGPPGAGKSTLVSLIISYLRKQNLKVAVLAVDPSSPFSGGALLGDRVRMGNHAEDSKVFIRSLGSRGGFGGLSASTGAMARVFDLCGFDVILVETVGVGQTELEIMNLVDLTTVVLVPESGDVIQTLKAGILEIADVFVINKADRPGADILANELKNLSEQEGANAREVFKTSALKSEGVEDLGMHILKLGLQRQKDNTRKERRVRGELRHLLLFEIDKMIADKISKIKIKDAYEVIDKLIRKVRV